MMLIGLAGQIASGKTTAATYMLEKYGFVRTAFASPLKETMVSLFELSTNQVTDLAMKGVIDPRYGKTPRELMQLFGTECVRNHIHPDFWVMKMRWQLQRYKTSEVSRVVIDDVRFDNEADLIRDMGGTVVHLYRMDNPHTGKDSHVSEEPIHMYQEDASISAGSPEELISSLDLFFGGTHERSQG
jgi:hypothetical protein